MIRCSRKSIERIELKNLSLWGLDGRALFENVNYEFKSGDIFRLVGNLGGCSEFLKLLSLLPVKTQGKLFYNNDDVLDYSFDEFQNYRLNVGYSFDYGGLLNNKTIKENILLPLHYHNELDAEEAEKRVEDYLARYMLEEFADLRPAMTPGYVRKLACVVRSLALDPEVLFLDGPTTAVDKERANILVNEIANSVQQGKVKIVIFTTTYESGFEAWKAKELDMSDFAQPHLYEVAA